MKIYLGIDVGTTAVKVLAIDGAGRVIAQASREYTYQTPQPGWVEQDAEDWWRLLCECVREVTSDCGAGACTPPRLARSGNGRRGTSPRPTVAALALSTQGDTVVPLDTEGKPLAPAITWMDTRALPLVAEMEREHDLWTRTTGAAPAAFSTATSLAWWRGEQPEVFAQAQRFALVADFLNARLTGRYLLDAPNASRTMLYDIVRREWSPELLQRVGVGVERLPQAAESGTVVGTVLPEVAADLGLSPETQVVLGGHDQTCGPSAAG